METRIQVAHGHGGGSQEGAGYDFVFYIRPTTTQAEYVIPVRNRAFLGLVLPKMGGGGWERHRQKQIYLEDQAEAVGRCEGITGRWGWVEPGRD